MEFSERDIEDLIWEARGFSTGNLVLIARQYQTNFGIIDLLGYDPNENELVVIELKKDTVDENAVGQLMRYMATLKEVVAEKPPVGAKSIKSVRGILVGADSSPGVRMIVRNFSFIEFYKYEVKTTISVDHENYDFTPEQRKADIVRANNNVYPQIKEIIQNLKEVEAYYKRQEEAEKGGSLSAGSC